MHSDDMTRVGKDGVATRGAENFIFIRENIDVQPFLREIAANAPLWEFATSRQRKTRSQRETRSIPLCEAVWPFYLFLRRGFESVLAPRFPATMAWLRAFENSTGASLGKALIVELKPHARVHRHIDTGRYYKPRDRYHLVLSSRDGSRMGAGKETAVFREGELWAFDNKRPHDAENPSDEGRIHLIFDLFPRRGMGLFPAGTGMSAPFREYAP